MDTDSRRERIAPVDACAAVVSVMSEHSILVANAIHAKPA